MSQVPDVNYYVFSEALENPYKDVPMNEQVDFDVGQPQMKAVKMEFSKLENGLRVASIDRQGLTSQLAIVVNTGARFEGPDEIGLSDMVKMMAFSSTAHLSHLRTVKTIEAMGGTASCQVGREHLLYHCETLREFMPISATLLVGNVLFPRLLEWEVNAVRQQWEDGKMPKPATDQLIDDLLHQTAFHNNTLGRSIWATEASAERFTPENIRNFMLKHFSMDKCAFVGVNVDHKELTTWLSRAFAEYTPVQPSGAAPTKPLYTGGYLIRESADSHGQVHVALGFPTEGWNSKDLIPSTVLQVLLGGGGSYSTGGPGKGMHSRLYLDVLNTKHYVDHCLAFNSVSSDAGLFGLTLSGAGKDAPKLIQAAADQMGKLNKFSTEELQRAKNMLKANMFASSENGKAVAEDTGRQVIMAGKYTCPAEFAALIDAVTEADLVALSQRILGNPVTMVVYGDVTHAPHITQVQKLFDRKK